jgi:hypothetical protein
MNPSNLALPNLEVVKARDFALKAHANQKYGERPYSYHLTHVVSILQAYDLSSSALQQAAWLHDTVEDCPEIEITHIEELFGAEVALLVYAVTGIGPARHIRTASTLAKLEIITGAVDLKAADRTANVICAMHDNRWDLVAGYLSEAPVYEELFSSTFIGSTLNRYMLEHVKPAYEKSEGRHGEKAQPISRRTGK